MTERYGTPTTPDRPEFDVLVDGESLGKAVLRDVIEIDVDERVDGHAAAEIMMRNHDPDRRAATNSEREVFRIGANIVVQLGYHGELREVFAGVITGVAALFPASSIPVAVIEARSRSILLASTERPRVFEETTLVDEFDTIAADYGLTAEVGDSGKTETRFDVSTDWARALATAKRHGWVSYVRDTELILRPPNAPSDSIELKYGTSILELRVAEDVRHLGDPVTAVMWDPANVEAITSETEAAGSDVELGDRVSLTDRLGDSDMPLRGVSLVTTERADQGEADARSVGAARRNQLRHITGRGAAIGIPDLRIDQWLTIEGIGARFNGPHYLSAVRHRLGRRGYTTEFTLGLPRPLVPSTEPTPAPALAIAAVTDLDDPLGWGRVKVEFPWAGDTAGAVWARVACTDAGPDYGTMFVPAVGHEVIVGFVADEPVVLGSLWNGASAVPEEVDPDANEVRLIKTPAGHKIRFDDGAATIAIESAAGSKVLLDDDNGAIELTESGGNSAVINGDGIQLTATTGDIVLSASSGNVKIDAVGIEGKATGPSKLESSATLDIKASATLGLQGALVNIN